MINSKKIVRDTIKFRNKDNRLPLGLNLRILRDYKDHYGETKEYKKIVELINKIPKDYFMIAPDIPGAGFAPPVEKGYQIDEETGGIQDEWGTVWKKEHPIKYPLSSLSDLNNYSFPDPNIPSRLDFIRKPLKKNKDENKYCIYWYGYTLFERITCLRGFEDHLTDIYMNKKEFLKIRDAIMEVNYQFIDNVLELGFDGVFIGDDLGSQKNLLINPDVWRKFYKPCYKELFALIHKYNTDVWMHSDGNIMSIVPDLIEIGLDVLNPVQPQVMDIIKLGKEYGGHLAFHGGLDVQYILPRGKKSEVAEHINLYYNNLGCYNGGYIPAPTNRVLEDVSLENLEEAIKVLMDKSKND